MLYSAHHGPSRVMVAVTKYLRVISVSGLTQRSCHFIDQSDNLEIPRALKSNTINKLAIVSDKFLGLITFVTLD